MTKQNKPVRRLVAFLLAFGLVAVPLPGFAASQDGITHEALPPAAEADRTPPITRTIDARQYFRLFPRLPAGRATSIQKAPAPILAELSERELGRPKITHCWLNLDEMWDYRTRQFDFNYRIGVPKYKDVKEKARDSWDWAVATDIHFYDYLRAFGKHSDEILLTIRRYERDILDGKLGLTMADWKEIFKQAVIHYRRICPNLRYVEVCNEYEGFIKCTADEYYEFYKAAYQAVNEANKELGLEGDARVLVGGPAVTGDIIRQMNQFFANFSKDPSLDKRLDFVSWHEYDKSPYEVALREGQIRRMLASYGIPADIPLIVTEHAPIHGPLRTHTLNLVNAAGLVKSLYFTSVYSPGVIICPWVLYHNAEIQTQFMWFAGPNRPDTRADELHLLPAGCSMKLLSMHKQWEIAVDNSLGRDELVLASVQNDGLVVHVVNYGEPRPVHIQVNNLPQVFTALGNGTIKVAKYRIDETHSNAVTDPAYFGGPQVVFEGTLTPENGSVTLRDPRLSQNGILLWVLVPEKGGPPLNDPVRHPTLPAKVPAETTADLPVLDFAKALDSAQPEAGAHIQRDGARLRVVVPKSSARPGVTFAAPPGGWSVCGLKAIEATVKNTSNRNMTVHLALEGFGAVRAYRLNCSITSQTIPAGEQKTLVMPILPLPPSPVAWLRDGKEKTFVRPASWATDGYPFDKVYAIAIYLYQPQQEYTFEVSALRAIPADTLQPRDH